ncbi:MAG TPA: TerC family protein [Candidatus Paceibacterota bacterium]|nr:TerC family protein [Verrucomicrobiota bacterium]HRY48496.1 TerC family protein [Candidatus Paceibacterota bacterium]HSA00322.1 TerC family protein [Candidatus Paceibacterota bacterium]
MPPTADIQWWHWAVFILVILFFLALDLGVFHRRAHVVKFGEALMWTGVWFSFAMLFAWGLRPWLGSEQALQFLTGYIIELSLSMDNVFVIAMIFAYFRVPAAYQHRVLFWGIMGALIMRGVMIGVGSALIARFHWMLYIFGAFLVVTGAKMLFAKEEGVHPEKNPILKLTRRLFSLSQDFDETRFITRQEGRRTLTPLALVLVMVETTDLIFALDSIPAIFAVTTDPFIVFTSNVCAILGLRSLYFVLAGALAYFRFLKYGLSIVLVFVGLKMLLPEHWRMSTSHALIVVVGILFVAIAVSLAVAWREKYLEKRKGNAAKLD